MPVINLIALGGESREPGRVSGQRDAPSGTVTFVMTDVEGSTKLARALGDAYAALIARHHALLRAIWRAHGGYEVFTEGDAFVVAFDNADEAVRAAIDAQRAIASEAWPGRRAVRIRIGLHAGYARLVGGDYQGLALNQAARIVGAAHGGQTFATDEVVGELTDAPSGLVIESLGRFRIRDFDEPVQLHALTAGGTPVIDAAPRVRPAEGHNIVPASTALVGRDDEVDQVIGDLAPGRVVTLTGPGGVGKTRLATEVGLRAAPAWRDGVWFVDLTSTGSPEDVPLTIARAVGASIAPGEDAWPNVLSHLEARRVLIVLDNCEHVHDAVAALVHDLAGRCPECATLATSRVPLGLRNEQVRRLGVLAVADETDPGVQLFLQRAPTGGVRFPMSDVIALCRELDGLPLAIELAAARTTAISPAEILERLRRTPAVLQSRDPGRPERHRSLTRSLDWGYGLLDDPTQATYRRLSVFVGGFELVAAERVCADDDLAAEDVAELVWALVDASLVHHDAAAGATRYQMLRVVRTHAGALAQPAEQAAAIRRLARLELDLVGPERPIDRWWRSAMTVELDNVRHVIAALAESDEPRELATAQTLAWSIGRYHDNTDAFRVGITEVGRWIERLRSPTPARAALHAILAELHLRLGEVRLAAPIVDEGLRLAASVGLPGWDEAGLERARGELALRRGDLDDAIAIGQAALANTGTARGRARLLNLLAIAHSERGDNEAAVQLFREEIAAAREAGMESFLVNSYGNLAEVQLRLGDVKSAAASQLACLELSRSSGGTTQQVFSMVVAAHLAAMDGAWQRAAQLQAAADLELDRIGWAFYGADAERRHRLLDSARRELGSGGFGAAVTEGQSLGIERAATIAADELERITARREQPV